MVSDDEYRRLRDSIRQLDPLLVEAADEIDPELIDWVLSLSPFERLRASVDAGKFLMGFRRVAPDSR